MDRIRSVAMAAALLGGLTAPGPATAQTESIVAELDVFWTGVVKSVVEWSLPAQKATYHPDAVGVYGTADSYTTGSVWSGFAKREVDTSAVEAPNRRRILEFRFSLRVHDASTAHEVGLYHFWAEGGEHYYGPVDSYLVKKDGRWLILVEIQVKPPVTKADWDALPPLSPSDPPKGGLR